MDCDNMLFFISGTITVGKNAFGKKVSDFGFSGKIPFGKKLIREKRRVPYKHTVATLNDYTRITCVMKSEIT